MKFSRPPLVSEHGRGGGYLKPTPGKSPVPPRGVVAPPKPPRRPSYTPAQEATMHAKHLLAPLYSQADVEADRQNQAIKSYTAAVMQQLAGLAPAIQSDYTNAINSHNAMVNAAADSLRAVNPSGDVAKLLSSIGAPAAQGQQIAGNLNNTFNGAAAVGQYVNGVLPLGSLQAQGEAAATLARLQPGFAALAGRQSLASALAQQSDARAKIAAQMPGLEQDWLNSFQSNKAKQQQLALEAQAAGLKQQNTDRSFKAQQDKYLRDYNLQVTKYNAGLSQDAAKAAMPNASLSRANGYLVDSSGKAILDAKGKRQILPGFNTNAQGRVVKAGSKASLAQKPFMNLTKIQLGTLRETASELRSGTKVWKNGQPVYETDANGNQILDKNGNPVQVFHPPLRYGKAINYLVSHGFARRDAIAMLNNFYPPGQGGRPVDTSLSAAPGRGPHR